MESMAESLANEQDQWNSRRGNLSVVDLYEEYREKLTVQ